MSEIIAKIHELQMHTTVAICDKEYLGKTFENEKISFSVSERFFGGEEINKDELFELVTNADSVNLFGNNCITLLEKEGLINQSSIIIINGIKHAQIYKLG